MGVHMTYINGKSTEDDLHDKPLTCVLKVH